MTGELEVGWHAERGVLRLERARLTDVAALAGGGEVDAATLGQLRDEGVVDADGRLAAGPALAGVASVAARLRLTATRVPCGGPGRRLELVAGPRGLVGFVPDDPQQPGGVGEVLAQPPDRVAATLWRLLRLGPRPDPPRSAVEVDAEVVRAAFDDGEATLAGRLGASPDQVALVRLDGVERSGSGQVAALVAVDAGRRGLWEATGDAAAVTLTPRTGEAVFAGLARVQGEARRAVSG